MPAWWTMVASSGRWTWFHVGGGSLLLTSRNKTGSSAGHKYALADGGIRSAQTLEERLGTNVLVAGEGPRVDSGIAVEESADPDRGMTAHQLGHFGIVPILGGLHAL